TNARNAFAAADVSLKESQQQRMAIWGGKEVREIETSLQAAIDTAKARQAASQNAAQQAAQTKTRYDEALAQAAYRLAALQNSATAAAARLSDWLYAFQQRQPDAGLQDLAQLRALLAHSSE